MKAKHNTEERHVREDLLHAKQGYDPLQTANSQSGTFNQSWLKNGESLTLLQRAGYTLLSLLFFGFGLFGVVACVDSFRDAAWVFVLIFGLASLFCMVLGVGGLRNVLRFEANHDDNHK
jgi:hypothetical protein